METIGRPSVFLVITAIVFASSACFYFLRTQVLIQSSDTQVAVRDDSFRAVVTIEEPIFEVATTSRCVQSVEDIPEVPELFDRTDQRLHHGLVIVVLKSARALMLVRNGQLENNQDGTKMCYRVALGIDSYGRSTGAFDKNAQGDRRTPEGWFRTSDKPGSSYKNAIRIHYPSDRHAARGLAQGRIARDAYDAIVNANARYTVPPQNTALGGEILIHGLGSSSDWTWGCVALDDSNLRKLRSALPEGMRAWILILP